MTTDYLTKCTRVMGQGLVVAVSLIAGALTFTVVVAGMTLPAFLALLAMTALEGRG